METKVCRQCEHPLPLTSFQPIGDGSRRGTCRKCRREPKKAVRQNRSYTPTPKFRRALDSKRYIITSAQNNTGVHTGFFETLLAAAKHLDAELVVVPLRYKNPTSLAESRRTDADLWWDPVTVPYLFNDRKKLGPHIVLAADVKTQPTASSPLGGFESLTGPESCIIAHPKMQLRMVPVPSGRYPKLLTTTGSCTKKNYSDTRAGKVGEFHHYLGAVLVELKGSKFFLRQLNADRLDGSFIDFGTLYTAKGAKKAPPALGLTLGDSHARYHCPKVDAATFGPGGIVETLDPQTLVFHDVFDGDTLNPHTAGNPFVSAARASAGMGAVEDELLHVVRFVNERAKGREAVIVDSNHHDFLARWVLREDWKRMDPKNAKFYLETALATLGTARMTPEGAVYTDPFGYWVNRLGVDGNIRLLGPDESFLVGDAEGGLHGHFGPNGSRGSLKNLSRLGTKTNIGHTHTPGIEEGGYGAGTSTHLRLGYNKGASSWANAHIATYANQKRAIIFIIDGEFRA